MQRKSVQRKRQQRAAASIQAASCGIQARRSRTPWGIVDCPTRPSAARLLLLRITWNEN